MAGYPSSFGAWLEQFLQGGAQPAQQAPAMQAPAAVQPPMVPPPAPAPAPPAEEKPLFVPRPGSFADRVSKKDAPRDEQGNLLLWPYIRDNVLPELPNPLGDGMLGGPPAAAAPQLDPSRNYSPIPGGHSTARPYSPMLGPYTTDATSAPELPPPVDIASRPVAGGSAQAEGIDPFKLAVGGQTTMAPPAANAALPANSQPAQGSQVERLLAQQKGGTGGPLAPPDNPSFLDRWSAAWHNADVGFPDMIKGGLTGQRLDPQGMAQQAMQNAYKALRARGYDDAQASFGASNPEALKEMVALPKWQVVREGLTGKQYDWVDAARHAVGGGGGGQGGVGGPQLGGGNGPHGQFTDEQWDAMTPPQRLATFSKQDQNYIEAVYHGQAQAPARLTQVLPLVTAVHPDFQQQDYFRSLDTQKSFVGQGKNALEKKALNTAITHADNLYRMIDELPNTQYAPGIINPLIHAFKDNTGDTQFQNLRGRYEVQAEGLANELSKMLNGGQTSQGDRDTARKLLYMARSPEELRSSIQQLMEMAHGRAKSLQALLDEGTHNSIRDPMNMVDPENQQVFMRLRGLSGGPMVSAHGQASPTQAAPLMQVPPPPAGFHVVQ